jgi:hypothetical protein
MNRWCRRAAGLVTSAAMAVVASGCAPDQTAKAPNAAYPQGPKAELQTLRDPNGLFIYPGYYRQPGSIYSTALVGSALGGWHLSPAQAKAARAAACQGEEPKLVHPAWFGWATSEVLGRDASVSSVPTCMTRTPPVASGDPAQDIPLLWAWAQAGVTLKEPRSGLARVVTPRLARLAVDRVTSPYVRWRLDELNALVGTPDTAVAHPAPPPSRLTDPTDLLDLWGYTQRCAAHRQLCVPSGVPTFDAVVSAERYFGDDLSLSAAIAIARVQGKDSAVTAYRASLTSRLDPATGLIRSARPEGDIASTFLVLQMAPELFPGRAAAATARVMQDDLRLGAKLDVVTRLKAIAILKALGGTAWTAFRPEVTAAIGGLTSSPVTLSSLQSRVDLVEALRLLDPNVPLVTLTPFATPDDRSQQLARLALAHADVFANAAAVRAAFAGVSARLLAQAAAPGDPLVPYFTAANAVSGAELQPDPARHQQIVTAMSGVQGCSLNGTAYTYLFRSSMATRESCSLEATWQAIRSGFAYGGS